MENLGIQYVMDQEGNKKAVLIPIADWNKLQEEVQQLREMNELKGRLSSSYSQMKKIKSGELPKTSLTSFLNEG
ncbi:MAG: hypothetical protein AAFR66_24945 [Bacteroidota bacterium]